MMSVKSLPKNPNIEYLKKEAKNLLADVKSGISDAANRIRSHKPQITGEIQLSDVQLVIAREYGFASWVKLRDHVLGNENSIVERAISNLKSGQMCILFDDEGRENEGDFVAAAEKVTNEQINFITKHGRGTLAMAISVKVAKRFGFVPIKKQPDSDLSPAFAKSFDASETTTGISASDRAKSIRTLMEDDATEDDLRFPGHTLPLIEHFGRLTARKGHTEGSLELVRRAGLKEGAVICEILNDDGTMARLPDLEKVADFHQLPLVKISDLLRGRPQ